MDILKNINSPHDLKKLPVSALPRAAEQIRELIIDTVSRTGGHLASSLGAVEIIIALHYVFNTPEDKIVYDVGHQAYAHKIITGRKKSFHSLRQLNGISGFIRPEESPYDTFASGHAGTAISAALGMAQARGFLGKSYKVAALIGDGTLTGGMPYEALNNAGHSVKNFLIILNDNEMAISPSVGAMSGYLNRIITSPIYNRIKRDTESVINKIPALGSAMVDIGRRIEEGLKKIIVPGMIFEELGFRYFGPVDGHNIKDLVDILKKIKDIEQPAILHILTQKGKGHRGAELAPEMFHGRNPSYAKNKGITVPSYTEVFGSMLCKLAAHNKKIVGITAAMAHGTGIDKLKKEFPKRTFDTGIAEAHAVTFAAGLASCGIRPVVAVYSTFLQRAYDQIAVDVCLQRLPVVFAVDRAGLVGEDGPTHHGAFDIAYMRHLPNMVIAQPKDENELQHMLYTAVGHNGPFSIRYPRGRGIGTALDTVMKKIEIGKAELIREGRDCVILALGPMLYTAKEAVRILNKKGIHPGLVNARFVKPLDEELLEELAENYKYIFTIEDHAVSCGFGSAVSEFLSRKNIRNISCIHFGIPDRFIPHGKTNELKAVIGLTPGDIADRIQNIIVKKPFFINPFVK